MKRLSDFLYVDVAYVSAHVPERMRVRGFMPWYPAVFSLAFGCLRIGFMFNLLFVGLRTGFVGLLGHNPKPALANLLLSLKMH